MEYRHNESLIFIRLHQNDDLFESLREICAACKLKVGVLISAIGMLKQAELNFFAGSGRYSPVLFPEPMELVSMTGNIIFQNDEYNFHFHAVLARRNKETVAGHLSKGKVNVTNELVILKTDLPAARKLERWRGFIWAVRGWRVSSSILGTRLSWWQWGLSRTSVTWSPSARSASRWARSWAFSR